MTTTDVCAVCDHADRTGSWVDAPGQTRLTHCRRCHGSWPRHSEYQHCTACCRTFTSAHAADRHRGPGSVCLDPAAMRDRHDRRVLVEATRSPVPGTTVTIWTGANHNPASRNRPRANAGRLPDA